MLGKEQLALDIVNLWQELGQPQETFNYDPNKDKEKSKGEQLNDFINKNFEAQIKEGLLKILNICNQEIEELSE